jgi:hypothetical protein
MMLTVKTITSVVKVSTYIITNIRARSIRLVVILALMSILQFTIVVILYIYSSDIFKVMINIVNVFLQLRLTVK